MRMVKVSAGVVLTAIGLAAVFLALREVHTRIVASYWRGQVAAAADDRVEIVIRQIGELDKAGIPILVQVLGSDRECVAQAAKQELYVRLEDWRRLSAEEYAARMTVLAQSLAGEVDHFSPPARRDAMDLAARILRRPLKGGSIDADKLLAASEKVLRTGLNTGGDYMRRKSAGLVDAGGLKFDDSLIDSSSTSSENVELIGQAVAGDGSSGEDESQAADSQANQPRLLEGQEASQSLGSHNQPPRASRIPDRAETGPQTASQDKRMSAADRVRSLSHVDSQAADRQLAASLAAEDIVGLMRELNGDDDARVAAVEAELIRRKFSAVQIELARRLFDPDQAVRKKLVQELPGLQGVDAVPWLLQLCQDANADVRLAAITFLATSSDPGVLDQIEQIAGRDADSGVRHIADRISQQRNARR